MLPARNHSLFNIYNNHSYFRLYFCHLPGFIHFFFVLYFSHFYDRFSFLFVCSFKSKFNPSSTSAKNYRKKGFPSYHCRICLHSNHRCTCHQPLPARLPGSIQPLSHLLAFQHLPHLPAIQPLPHLPGRSCQLQF